MTITNYEQLSLLFMIITKILIKNVVHDYHEDLNEEC